MGGSSGGGNTTTVQKADPWKPAQPFLQGALKNAKSMYKSGQFTPYVPTSSGVAPFGADTMRGFGMVRNEAAGGTPMVDQAQGTLGGIMRGNVPYADMLRSDPRLMDLARTDPRLASMMSGTDIYRNLGKVKGEALGSAIPAAVSMFAGNGMTDSSAAMDTVGRAATEAVAPIDYGAWQAAQDRRLSAIGLDDQTRLGAIGQNAQTRLGAGSLLQGGQLSAAGMAPGLTAAGYLPAQMLAASGAQQDQHAQAGYDDYWQRRIASKAAPGDAFQRYLQMIQGVGGMGSTGSATGPSGQPSGAARVAGAGLGGLGAYGALSAIPGIGMPLAAGGGILAALSGLL